MNATKLNWYKQPKTLRPAKGKKNCGNCAHFSSVPQAYPGGWCDRSPCKKVNCDINGVCDKWENAAEIRGRSLDELSYEQIKEMSERGELRKGMTKTIILANGKLARSVVVVAKGTFSCGKIAEKTIFMVEQPAEDKKL